MGFFKHASILPEAFAGAAVLTITMIVLISTALAVAVMLWLGEPTKLFASHTTEVDSELAKLSSMVVAKQSVFFL